MTITIKENSSGGATLLASTTTIVNAFLPEIIFLKGSFEEILRPQWSEIEALNQDTDFADYNGSRSTIITVVMNLYGSNRNTNLEIIRNFKSKILYLDASEFDSNVSGTYVMHGQPQVIRDEKFQTIKIKMRWREYDNGS